MDPASLLQHYKSLVEPKIRSYLSDPPYPPQFSIPAKYQSEVDFHWQTVSDYPNRPSKYLRPCLIMLVSEAMGIANDLAVPTAAAIQVSEEWILIHDDFEDDSTLRRGQPALHRKYGAGLAVNAGDALQVIMWSILLENFPLLGEKKALSILNEFRTLLTRTTIGQAVEMKWMRDNKIDVTDADWYFVANSKTSYYTIAGPLRLGGLVAGANPDELNSLSELGNPLGYCFQLVDDLLDLTSDFSGRKEQYGDIYEGKRTLMLGHLLRTADTGDHKKIVEIMSKSRDQKTPDEVAWIVNRMQHYQSLEYGQKIASQFRDQTLKVMAKLKFLNSQPARANLEVLANFVLTRDH